MTRKHTAISFLERCAAGHARDAFRDLVSAGFKHHNPYFPADAASLWRAMDDNAHANPEKKFHVLHALEDGDLVAVHSRVEMKKGDRPIAVVHLMRFEGDRIAELWDVALAEPEKSLNANGMF